MIYKFLLVLSWFFLIIGVAGLFRFKGVFTKLLSSSKIDSVTIITIVLALIFKSGLTMMSLKLVIILSFYLITNPVTNQIIAISAYRNGIDPQEGDGV
jgi:multicomponent Na+:H+ antiporter subunit G